MSLLARIRKGGNAFSRCAGAERRCIRPNQYDDGVPGPRCGVHRLSPTRTARRSDRMPEREGIDNDHRRGATNRYQKAGPAVVPGAKLPGHAWFQLVDLRYQTVGGAKIKQSGIPYTIFYPSTFMESFDRIDAEGQSSVAGRHVESSNVFCRGGRLWPAGGAFFLTC